MELSLEVQQGLVPPPGTDPEAAVIQLQQCQSDGSRSVYQKRTCVWWYTASNEFLPAIFARPAGLGGCRWFSFLDRTFPTAAEAWAAIPPDGSSQFADLHNQCKEACKEVYRRLRQQRPDSWQGPQEQEQEEVVGGKGSVIRMMPRQPGEARHTSVGPAHGLPTADGYPSSPGPSLAKASSPGNSSLARWAADKEAAQQGQPHGAQNLTPETQVAAHVPTFTLPDSSSNSLCTSLPEKMPLFQLRPFSAPLDTAAAASSSPSRPLVHNCGCPCCQRWATAAAAAGFGAAVPAATDAAAHPTAATAFAAAAGTGEPEQLPLLQQSAPGLDVATAQQSGLQGGSDDAALLLAALQADCQQGWSLDALLGLFAPAGGLSPAGVLPDGFGSGLPPATVPASPPATTAAAADMRGAQQISGCSDLSASSWTPLNSTVPGLLDSSWQLLPALAHTSESPLAATQQVPTSLQLGALQFGGNSLEPASVCTAGGPDFNSVHQSLALQPWETAAGLSLHPEGPPFTADPNSSSTTLSAASTAASSATIKPAVATGDMTAAAATPASRTAPWPSAAGSGQAHELAQTLQVVGSPTAPAPAAQQQSGQLGKGGVDSSAADLQELEQLLAGSGLEAMLSNVRLNLRGLLAPTGGGVSGIAAGQLSGGGLQGAAVDTSVAVWGALGLPAALPYQGCPPSTSCSVTGSCTSTASGNVQHAQSFGVPAGELDSQPGP